MKKILIALLLALLICVPVAASVFPERWSDADRENFKTLYGDVDVKEFLEVADTEGFNVADVTEFLNTHQTLIAAGLAVDGEGYLVDSEKLQKALEEEQKRQEELNKQESEKLVITVPEAPSDDESKAPLNTTVIIAVCAILLGGVLAVILTSKKKK